MVPFKFVFVYFRKQWLMSRLDSGYIFHSRSKPVLLNPVKLNWFKGLGPISIPLFLRRRLHDIFQLLSYFNWNNLICVKFWNLLHLSFSLAFTALRGWQVTQIAICSLIIRARLLVQCLHLLLIETLFILWLARGERLRKGGDFGLLLQRGL